MTGCVYPFVKNLDSLIFGMALTFIVKNRNNEDRANRDGIDDYGDGKNGAGDAGATRIDTPL